MGEHLGTQKVFRFSEEELQLLDQMAKAHGSQKAAVMAGLRALQERAARADGLSDSELIEAVTKRIRESKRNKAR